MNIRITGRHIRIPESVRNYAQQKVLKLPRIYDNIQEIEVIVDNDKNGNSSVEMIARLEHHRSHVVKSVAESSYKGIDMTVHKLENHLRKVKGKERENKHTEETY